MEAEEQAMIQIPRHVVVHVMGASALANTEKSPNIGTSQFGLVGERSNLIGVLVAVTLSATVEPPPFRIRLHEQYWKFKALKARNGHVGSRVRTIQCALRRQGWLSRAWLAS